MRKRFWIIGALLAALLLAAFDCRMVIRKYQIDAAEIESPVRIALVTDLHSCRYGEKQKKLIDEIHRRGGEVLISCHTGCDPTLEENLMIANAQIERGADVIKIVDVAKEKASIPKYLDAIQKITSSTDRKLLFLASGEGELIRYIGPNFGVCMYLCVESHGPLDTPQQPNIARVKAIRDNIIFK
jgi:3-dehydroquinate dehydratase